MSENMEEKREEEAVVAKEVSKDSKGRKERIPFGVPRQKLSVPSVPGKVRRWVNDTEGRCQQATEGGYEFVTDNGLKIGQGGIGSGNQALGKRVSRVVGTKVDGKPMTAYLMEIDEELYNEDQAEKQQRIDEIDSQIRGGNFEGKPGDGRYIPKEGISLKT